MKESQTKQTVSILDKNIGEIVAEDYRTAGIFEKYGIDFCCGGKVALSAACRQKGIDAASLAAELDTVKKESPDRTQNYDSWELPFLMDYIVNTHHVYLKENDAQIAAYAEKIASVHGAHHVELFEIASIFGKIATDMTTHLQEEEDTFFPAVKRAYANRKAGRPVDSKDVETIRVSLGKLIHEHEEIGEAVHTIRSLSKEYAIPNDVCNTFVVTYRKLKEFEDDLHKHVHLENNILFPKAKELIG